MWVLIKIELKNIFWVWRKSYEKKRHVQQNHHWKLFAWKFYEIPGVRDGSKKKWFNLNFIVALTKSYFFTTSLFMISWCRFMVAWIISSGSLKWIRDFVWLYMNDERRRKRRRRRREKKKWNCDDAKLYLNFNSLMAHTFWLNPLTLNNFINFCCSHTHTHTHKVTHSNLIRWQLTKNVKKNNRVIAYVLWRLFNIQ